MLTLFTDITDFATAAAWERECTERSTLFVSASFDGQSIAVLYKFIERPRKKLPVSAKKRWDKAQFTFRFLATGADAPSPKDPENGALHNFHKFRICIINTRTDVCMNTIIWMEHRMFVCVCVCVCVYTTHTYTLVVLPAVSKVNTRKTRPRSCECWTIFVVIVIHFLKGV
jgi:hypothetical protein